MIKYSVEEAQDFTFVKIDLPSPIMPAEMLTVQPPEVDATKGVVLSGRAPVWLYAFLTHYYHHCKWVATHDPRLGGAVVVMTHTPDVGVGQIIRLK